MPAEDTPGADASPAGSTAGDLDVGAGAGETGPLAPWHATPVQAGWQRADCDPERAARPSGNAPPRAPFNGSLSSLFAAVEAGFQLEVSSMSVDAERAIAHVETANGTDTVTVARAGEPSLDLRLHRPWPATNLRDAWREVNATMGRMGLPAPTQAQHVLEQPMHFTAEFLWPGAGDGLGSASVDVIASGSPHGPLSRVGLYVVSHRWPAATDNASLEQAAVGFLDCQVGPGWEFSFGAVGAWAGSTGRWMQFRLPQPGHHCGGPSYEVAVDAVTRVVLAHRPGQPCI